MDLFDLINHFIHKNCLIDPYCQNLFFYREADLQK